MATVVEQNQSVHNQESKSAKKKKAKAAIASEDRNESPAPGASPEQGSSVAGNDAPESPYVLDLKKQLRNITKKISKASETQAIVDQHKEKSIQQLLAAKIINADQKRRLDNKPQFEADLARTADHLAEVTKLETEWRSKLAQVKADTEKTLADRYEQEKADAVAEATRKAEADAKHAQQSVEDGFLAISQFLRLAAQRRQAFENVEVAEDMEDENRALEGILLGVYAGDENAVAVMSKLYEGSDDTTEAIDGASLKTTFRRVRDLAADKAQPSEPSGESTDVSAPEAEGLDSPALVQTDPTVAYAGLTEIDAGTDVALTNGDTNGTAAETEVPIPNADTGDNAANAAAEAQWDAGNDLATSQEWVEVQKPAESPQAQAAPTPAPAVASNPSWADEHPDPSAPRNPAEPNDGFQSVQRNRGRENGDGFRGGRGGHHRGGRGGNTFRGDGGRGRGRGGPRGPRHSGNAGARRDGGGKAAE